MLVCALFGMFNGALITGFGIVPFIVTLGTMQIARGVAKWMADQTTIDAPKTWLSGMMKIEPVKGAVWSVAPGVWVLVVLLAFMFVMLRYTTFGRHIFAVGSNEATARLCAERGVAVQTIKSIARGPWAAGVEPSHTTWYQPLENEADIRQAVQFGSSFRRDDGLVPDDTAIRDP